MATTTAQSDAFDVSAAETVYAVLRELGNGYNMNPSKFLRGSLQIVKPRLQAGTQNPGEVVLGTVTIGADGVRFEQKLPRKK